MTDPLPSADADHSRRAAPRTILLWVVLLMLVALGLYAAAPWILPVRIIEGPLVQMTSTDAATLVWYTSRPAECTAAVTTADGPRSVPVQTQGARHAAHIAGLTAGTRYPYEIRAGTRLLTGALAFQTARSADERFSFLVFGDSGRGTRAQYRLAQQMLRAEPPPDFLLHTGDIVYGAGERHKYEERFFAPYRALLARVNFWPCLGNHDLGAADTDEPNAFAPPLAYQEVFEVPQNGPAGSRPDCNYWFDHANARFAVFDSNQDEAALRTTVAPWLTTVFAGASGRWKIVVCHHPPYTGGRYARDLTVRNAIVPALETAGVDLVFSGHDHNYQRTHPLLRGDIVPAGTGIVYVVSGAGGASLYSASEPRPAFVAALNDQEFSFTHVIVAGDTLTLRQIDIDGRVLDEYKLQKAPVQ